MGFLHCVRHTGSHRPATKTRATNAHSARSASTRVCRHCQLLTVRVGPRPGFVARGDARGHGPRKGKFPTVLRACKRSRTSLPCGVADEDVMAAITLHTTCCTLHPAPNVHRNVQTTHTHARFVYVSTTRHRPAPLKETRSCFFPVPLEEAGGCYGRSRHACQCRMSHMPVSNLSLSLSLCSVSLSLSAPPPMSLLPSAGTVPLRSPDLRTLDEPAHRRAAISSDGDLRTLDEPTPGGDLVKMATSS